MRPERRNIIIMGAAGRDFHDFNVFWKNQPDYRVVAFTAAQIPDMAGRMYPSELAGPDYPDGIPIEPESRIIELIEESQVKEVVLSYSDLSYLDVMHKAAIVNSAGADFRLMGWKQTMISSRKPVIAVCAVRTGCGKSQTSRKVCQYLKELGKKVAVVRHPMPYGDLTRQVCQRFATLSDLDLHRCTIEEREEFEPHIEAGNLVFAGIDYPQILYRAEQEADVILWDGGNNDLPFFKPTLSIVVTDPHRSGHEIAYYPGETNVRMADILIINKVDSANFESIKTVEANIRSLNSRAVIMWAESPLSVTNPESVKGSNVLVLEDGPTVTHGEMAFGAAYLAAKQLGARQIVDPRPFAVGSLKATFEAYRHITEVLPAIGYGDKQIADLEKTINATPCDLVVVGTPIDISRVLKIDKPTVRVTYTLRERNPELLRSMIERAVSR